ncbi:MAG: hypothetical protein QXU82_02210 [Candidatus Aenigmatarchaeota archaeon]
MFVKKFACLLAVLAVIGSAAFAASLTITYSVLDSYVRPGSQTTVMLTFTNPSTTEEMSNLKVAVSAGPGLSVTPSLIEVGTLGIAAAQQASVVVTASQAASAQQSYISIDASYGSGAVTKQTRISVPITIRNPPLLQISNVKFAPAPEPGSTVEMSFDVLNNGDGPAKDVSISLTQSSGLFTVSGSSEGFIPSIAAKGKETVKFSITIDPKASVGTQLIPVKFVYYDEGKSASYDETKSIGLPISGTADLIVTVDRTTGFYFGRTGIVTIAISNSGTGSAEYMTVKISSPYGSKEAYVGRLEPDDTETIDVEQNLAAATGKYDITVGMSYRDSYNNPFTVERKVSAAPTGAPIEVPWGWLVLIVMVGAGYWWFKLRKK